MKIRKIYEMWKPLIMLLLMVFFLLFAMIVNHHLAPKGDAERQRVEESQIEEGVNLIKAEADVDVGKVETKLEKMESQETTQNLDSGNFNAIFANAGFMGDSMAEGFSAFKLLNTSHVGAVKGHGLTNYQEDLAKMKVLSPKYLFINYGLNNMGTYQKDTDRFVEDYEKLIDTVQETLPNAKIFILNIMPVQKEALTKQPYLGYTSDYNKALKEMCKSRKLNFIDSSSVVKDEYYAKDHIHMGTEMHAEWLRDIATKSGLAGNAAKTSDDTKTSDSTKTSDDTKESN